jgi:fibronectin-binding autotransporter adhesin
VFAATQYSTGTFTWGTDSKWSAISGSNYVNAWGSGNDAIFEGAAVTASIAAAGVTAHNLSFNNTGYLIQNNTLTLNGTTPTITVGGSSSRSATISSSIAGTAGFTKAGAGTLTLSGANAFTGTMIVTGGTLTVDAAAGGALGSATPLTFNNGTTGGGTFVYNFAAGSSVNLGALIPTGGNGATNGSFGDYVVQINRTSGLGQLTFASGFAADTSSHFGPTLNFVADAAPANAKISFTTNVATGWMGGMNTNASKYGMACFFNGDQWAWYDSAKRLG